MSIDKPPRPAIGAAEGVKETIEKIPDVTTLTPQQLENEIKRLLGGFKGIRSIEDFSITGSGDKLRIKAKLDHEDVGGSFGLEAVLKANQEGIGIKDEDIEVHEVPGGVGRIKRAAVKWKINSKLSELVPKIEEFLSKKYGKSVRRLLIEGGNLKVTFPDIERVQKKVPIEKPAPKPQEPVPPSPVEPPPPPVPDAAVPETLYAREPEEPLDDVSTPITSEAAAVPMRELDEPLFDVPAPITAEAAPPLEVQPQGVSSQESQEAKKPFRPGERLFEERLNKRGEGIVEAQQWLDEVRDKINALKGSKKANCIKKLNIIQTIVQSLRNHQGSTEPEDRHNAERALAYLSSKGIVDLSTEGAEGQFDNGESGIDDAGLQPSPSGDLSLRDKPDFTHEGETVTAGSETIGAPKKGRLDIIVDRLRNRTEYIDRKEASIAADNRISDERRAELNQLVQEFRTTEDKERLKEIIRMLDSDRLVTKEKKKNGKIGDQNPTEVPPLPETEPVVEAFPEVVVSTAEPALEPVEPPTPLPEVEPTTGATDPEKNENLSNPRFETSEYAPFKEYFDPMRRLLVDTAGLSEEDVDDFYVQYQATTRDPNDRTKGITQRFDTYHDYLTWRRSLSLEENADIELPWEKTVKGPEGDSVLREQGMQVYASNFWSRLDDPNDPLYKHRDAIHQLDRKLRVPDALNEADGFDKAVEEGRIPQIDDPRAAAIMSSKRPSFTGVEFTGIDYDEMMRLPGTVFEDTQKDFDSIRAEKDPWRKIALVDQTLRHLDSVKEVAPKRAERKEKKETKESAEKPSAWRKVASIGLLVQHKKNAALSSAFGWYGKKLERELRATQIEVREQSEEARVQEEGGYTKMAQKLRDQAHDAAEAAEIIEARSQSTIARVLTGFAKGYEKSAVASEKQRQAFLKKEGVKASMAGWGALTQNSILMTRAVAGSLGGMSRIPAIVAMVANRSFDAFKEARLAKYDVINKTRVNDAERAYEEAEQIYKISQRMVGEGNKVTAKDLAKAYADELPKDLIRRFERGDSEKQPSYLGKLVASVGVRGVAERLQKKFEAIENNTKLNDEQKKLARAKEIQKNEALLRDLDRMVSDAGVVDTTASVMRDFGQASKKAAAAVALETLAEAGFNFMMPHDESVMATTAATTGSETPEVTAQSVAQRVSSGGQDIMSNENVGHIDDLKHGPLLSETNVVSADAVVPTEPYTVKSGDKLWKLLADDLRERKIFNGLSAEGQRDYVIDALKDKIAAMSDGERKLLGISSGNINKLTVGDKLDFNKLFDHDVVGGALKNAKLLSAEEISAIESYVPPKVEMPSMDTSDLDDMVGLKEFLETHQSASEIRSDLGETIEVGPRAGDSIEGEPIHEETLRNEEWRTRRPSAEEVGESTPEESPRNEAWRERRPREIHIDTVDTTGLTESKAVDKYMTSTLSKFYGTDKEELTEWPQHKDVGVKRFLSQRFSKGSDGEGLQKLILEAKEKSGLEPKGRFFWFNRSVSGYLRKAFTVIVKKERA